MSDARLTRLVGAHLCAVVAEWTAVIGVLVYSYRWGGSFAVGFGAFSLEVAPVLGSPLAAQVVGRVPAHRARLAGFAVQAAAYGLAAILVALAAPAPAVAGCVAIGLAALATLRPTGALLMPLIARTTAELVEANLRISYCDSGSALIGPLVAAALARLGGPYAVFGACAAFAIIGWGATSFRPAQMAVAAAPSPRNAESPTGLRVATSELRRRPWTFGVLGVSCARNLLIGAFDVLLTVLALTSLRMGEQGPGLLTSLVGAGALASTLAIRSVVRRNQLRRSLITTMLLCAAICLAISALIHVPLVIVLLPIIGICMSLLDNLSRMLMQRSTGPQALGPLFALLGLIAGLSQLAGVGFAQVAMWAGDLRIAFAALGMLVGLLCAVTLRSLRAADANADVPVVEMSLLGGISMFTPLPTATMEMVARSAAPRRVSAGEEIIRQGDPGDEFYAVVEGNFSIEMNGVYLRSAPRGDFFGEVALLSNRPRTATVRAVEDGELLVVQRDPFLLAVTGHEASHSTALAYVVDMDLEHKMRWTAERQADDRSGLEHP